MTQVIFDCTCPNCGPWVDDVDDQLFRWFNSDAGTLDATIIVETDGDNTQWPFVVCSKCDYREMLDETQMIEILIDRYEADSEADLFCMIVRTLTMQKSIRDKYQKVM